MKGIKVLNVLVIFALVFCLAPSPSAQSNSTEAETYSIVIEEDIILSNGEKELGELKKGSTYLVNYDNDISSYEIQWNDKFYVIDEKFHDSIKLMGPMKNTLKSERAGSIHSSKSIQVLDEKEEPVASIFPKQEYEIHKVTETNYYLTIGEKDLVVKKDENIIYSSVISEKLEEQSRNEINKDTDTVDQKVPENTSDSFEEKTSNEPEEEVGEEKSIADKSAGNGDPEIKTVEADRVFDEFFEVTENSLPVYDNQGVKLRKVGELLEGKYIRE
ncbi:hypothetical protein D3H55_01690 [Bacillus salacetis]|uniref:Copper amine oxidase-like N-terminal domain-containing protein n=1 Tax=Bacillus salacetis TaxID=2315464 RepID=A0A3A1R9C6_9BACI|nr:hypothetical protein [Bacillus salacetis]RIW39089.1 hypothetical protein D3H55_01690 [Bacillus salacetis]